MRILSSILVGSMLVACGGGDDGGGGGGGGATVTSVSDFYTQFIGLMCMKAFECCTAEEVPQYFGGFLQIADEPDCEAKLNQFFMSVTPMYDASIAAGDMTFHADNAGDCVDVIAGLTCTQFSSSTLAIAGKCASPFEGHVANGTACQFDEECQSDYCEGDSQLVNQHDGVCKPKPAAGEACPDGDCVAGQQCQQGTCMALKADGASCYSGDECAAGACVGAGGGQMGTCGMSVICNGV